MNRWDIIQKLIDKYKYERYLEIGVNKKRTFDKIKIKTKIGVDPNKDTDFKMTSDEFFQSYYGAGFDIIFIDGCHFADYAYRDFVNSSKNLNPGGAIVMHDCKPYNEMAQLRPDFPGQTNTWNGSVWRAWLKLRSKYSDDMFVVDVDHGVGIYKFQCLNDPAKAPCESLCLMEYTEFAKRQKELLNLITEKEFLEWIGK
jgi:hypothetical protein